MTIIGVVAAITLPSLTGNINERTWNTQRKALYARMSQAIALMPALNGCGTLTAGNESTSAVDTAAETFVTEGLSKVLKINNICDNEHYQDCGLASTITTLKGDTMSMPLTIGALNPQMLSASTDLPGGINKYSALNTKAAAFETQNGESVLLFYNPNCINLNETWMYMVQPRICVNMVYDLNGNKGPNTVGKDIGFITVLNPTDSSVVAPMPFNSIITGVTSDNAGRVCTQNVGDEYRLPTKDELGSLFINRSLLGYSTISGGSSHWYSSSKFSAGRNWLLVMNIGEYRVPDAGAGWSSVCVKR